MKHACYELRKAHLCCFWSILRSCNTCTAHYSLHI